MESSAFTFIFYLTFVGLLGSAGSETVPATGLPPNSALPVDIPLDLVKVAGILRSKEFSLIYMLGGDSEQGFGDFAVVPDKRPASSNGADVDLQPWFIRVSILKMNLSQVEELRALIPPAQSEIFNIHLGEETNQPNEVSDIIQQDEESSIDLNLDEVLNISEDDSSDVHHIEAHTVPASRDDDMTRPKMPFPVTDEKWRAEFLGWFTMTVYFALMCGFVFFSLLHCFCRLCCGCSNDCSLDDLNDDNSYYEYVAKSKAFALFGKNSKRASAYERI